MDIKKQEPEDKVITFFGEIKSGSVESAVKDMIKIQLKDQKYMTDMRHWADDNGVNIEGLMLDPIRFILCTPGGSCYDGMALHDAIRSSQTPVEVICHGKVMSMGVVVALAADVRKAHANTTFMIHQVSGLLCGPLQDMEESVEETKRINEMLFRIITDRTSITKEQLDDLVSHKRDWFITAQEALKLGIITDIL